MFTVFFNQKSADGTIARSNATYDTLTAAKARFYLELAQAGNEGGPEEVKAIILDDDFKVCAVASLAK